MSAKVRVCVAITARPSYSRIRTALSCLERADGVDLKVLCSGSALLERYGRVVDFIRADGFDVAEEIFTFVEGNEPINMALTAANTLNHTASALRQLKPDWVVTIADRYETLGTAVAAAYLGIPLIHIQGGEVTGNIDEKVRHSITKLADVHLVANESAAVRVRRMGEDPSTVHVTGCPSIDIARESVDMPLSEVQRAVDTLGVGSRINVQQDYAVVLLHPETDTYQQSFDRMMMLLDAITEVGLPTLLFWPNVDAGSDATSKAIRVFRESLRFPAVHYMKNLEGHVFLRLLRQGRVLIGNSSVGIRECAYLGTPVVNIGDRQHGRERAANVLDCDWGTGAITAAIRTQLAHGPYPCSSVYGDGYAGETIARVIAQLAPVRMKRFHDS